MKKFINEYKFLILCFFIPILFFTFAIFLIGLYPFGNYALCPYDSLHQYISFLEEYRYKLINRESLFFSFRTASSNFYTIWLYYLTSPFNLMVIFFKDSILAIEVITILKIAFIGLSFGLYLYKTYKKKDISIFLFSMCYTFSSYVITYYCNIMWLDTIMLFPWVLYYMKKMLKKENTWAYSLILSFTIFCNFYMAINLCIILCLFFLMQDFTGIKDFIKKGIRFSIFSILSGLMSAVSFLPFMSIGTEKLSTIPNPSFLTDFASLFSSFAAFAEKHISMSYESNANIYCSIFALLLFVLYITDKKISLEKRIKNLFLVTFLFISLNISTLDFIIHGFAKPTGYNGRYSYILIFLILTCAYEEFIRLKQIKTDRLLVSSFLLITLFLGSLIYISVRGAQTRITISISISVILIFAYIGLKILHNIKNRKEIFYILFAIELLGTAIIGFKTSDVENLVSAKKVYQQLDKYDGEFREEIDVRAASNETTFNNMNSMSLFSSTITKPFTEFHYNLGLRGGSNYVTGFGHSPVVDILYNIQYVYNKETAQYFNFEKLNRKDGYAVYKNNYETSYAYIIPKTIMNWDWHNKNPFSNLNNFVGYYFNEHSSNTYVYDLISCDDIKLEHNFDNIEEKKSNNYGVYFEKEKGSSGKIDFIYEAKDSSVSINVKYGNISSFKVYVNDEQRISDNKVNGDIINVFNLSPGDIVRVEIKVKSDVSSGTIYCNFATFNEENYTKFAKDITSNRIEVKTTSNSLYGEFEYKEDSIILFSIPYDEGWKLTINNDNAYIYDDICLITTSLNESGNFKLVYTPPLFYKSLLISLSSWGVYLIIILISYFLKKKRTCF